VVFTHARVRIITFAPDTTHIFQIRRWLFQGDRGFGTATIEPINISIEINKSLSLFSFVSVYKFLNSRYVMDMNYGFDSCPIRPPSKAQ
jgi:hypothetical protein